MGTTPPESSDVQRTIDREVDLIASAIDLVASGRATATTVAGLRLAEAALTIVRPRAAARGVLVEALWGADEGTTDVRVRRIGEAHA
jgi:hypothetical protein